MMKPRIAVVLFLAAIVTSLVDRAFAQSAHQDPVDTILFGSCIDQEKPVPILRTILSHSPDVFVFLGDNIYADTEDMEIMRTKYEGLAARENFQKLLATSEVLAVWDDHDYGGNDGGADYAKRAESERQFLDFWHEPAGSSRRERPGIYASKILGPEGKRLQIILLDTRYFRSPLKKGDKRVGGSWVPDDNPDKTMLGADQWEWLEKQLREPAEIRIIASSIQCVAQDAGQETWSNLPRERRRLFDLIKTTKATGCFLISGDRHWSEFSMTDENALYPIYDFTSSSLNKKHPRGTPTDNRYRVSPTTYHHENFGRIHINWNVDNPSITLEIRDIDDGVRFEKLLQMSELSP